MSEGHGDHAARRLGLCAFLEIALSFGSFRFQSFLSPAADNS